MSDQPPQSRWVIFWTAILYSAGLASIWFASGFLMPRMEARWDSDGPVRDFPAFFAFALHIWEFCFHAVWPLGFIGAVATLLGLLQPGPKRLVSICGSLFP